jgi:hypothetical protein
MSLGDAMDYAIKKAAKVEQKSIQRKVKLEQQKQQNKAIDKKQI